jgi:hypothetical protein
MSVLLALGDTGAGMDGETLRHIFEPLFTTRAISICLPRSEAKVVARPPAVDRKGLRGTETIEDESEAVFGRSDGWLPRASGRAPGV